MELQVATYGKVVARATLIAHAMIGAAGTEPSIEGIGLGKDVIVGNPSTSWRQVEGMGGVGEGWRQVEVVNLLPSPFVAVAPMQIVGDAYQAAMLAQRTQSMASGGVVEVAHDDYARYGTQG